MNILPKEEFMPYMYESLAFIKSHMSGLTKGKFSELEYEKFRRVVDYMETTHYSEEKLKEGRKDFHAWFTEHDKRRKTDFVTTFPHLAEFYRACSV
jgi:hypothetical protein